MVSEAEHASRLAPDAAETLAHDEVEARQSMIQPGESDVVKGVAW